MSAPTLERVLELIAIEGDCWIFKGSCLPSGYGRFSTKPSGDGTRQHHYAHRVAYEEMVGPIPSGFDIHHTCERKPCVNPDHLEAVPHHQHPYDHLKLSDDEVAEIRRRDAAGESQKALAAAYGVHQSYVNAIVRFEKRRPRVPEGTEG